MQIRRTAAALTSAAALSFTGVAMATPASAAPVVTGGLVNVTIVDVANNNRIIRDVNVGVAAAVGVVATVCPVVQAQVGIIAQQIARTGEFTCTAVGGAQRAIVTQA